MSLNCVINDLSIRIFGCLCPNGKTEPAAALQDTTRLSAGSAWIGQMEQRKVCQNSVEAPVAERKVLRVASRNLMLGNIFFAIETICFEKSRPIGTAPRS